jgi:hypothetical protein
MQGGDYASLRIILTSTRSGDLNFLPRLRRVHSCQAGNSPIGREVDLAGSGNLR